MPDDRRVQEAVNQFVDQITTIAREIAAEVVLAGVRGPRGAAKASSNGVRAKASGAKRSPAKLAALQDKVLAFVRSHAGMRVEQINAALGTETSEITLPIKKLIAAKSIRAQGSRRATKYFAGSGAKKKTKKAKRSKR